jgi:hypothetical protein
LPGDRVGWPAVFRKHRNERRYSVNPWPAIVAAIRARGAIQDGPRDFECAIDRRRRDARSQPIADKVLEGAIVNALHLEHSNVREQQTNVPSRISDRAFIP